MFNIISYFGLIEDLAISGNLAERRAKKVLKFSITFFSHVQEISTE